MLIRTMRSDGDFEAFYQASYHRLVGQLTTLTGSLEDAEDAVQEAFARASTRWARLRDYDAPEAWVRRVAFNLATSGLRRARRQLTALARLGAAAAEPGRSTDRLAIEAGLRRLPLHYRQVLVLHYGADLPVEQVAEQLRLPIGTVKSRLSRARADQAPPPPPPIAAIRRRGRLRRARLASGAVLLIAVATGLVAMQGPLDRRTTPAPVVTQPPRPIQPGPGFADYVRGRFDDMLVDMTVVTLASGKAADDDWQLAAVRGTSRRSQEDKVCLVHKTDGRSHGYGFSCRDEASNRVTDRMTSGGGGNEQPLWGLVPEGAARVRLLRPGSPPVEVPAMEIGPGFRRRYYLAPRPQASEPWWPWMRRDT